MTTEINKKIEIFQDGASEILEHIESLRRAKFQTLLENYDTDKDKLGYNFSIKDNSVMLSIVGKYGQKICEGEIYLIGETEKREEKHIFIKNTSLDTVLSSKNSDEIVNEIINYNYAADQHPYFISVIMGAYLIGFDFDYLFSINDKFWGMKNINWTEQIIGEDLVDE